MPQTQSSTKPINNNLSIGFANDNFSLKKQFLLKTKTLNLPQNISSSFPFKTNLSSTPNSSLNFKNFKNSPHSLLNASSLFCAFGLKTTRAGVCVISLTLIPEPVLARKQPLWVVFFYARTQH